MVRRTIDSELFKCSVCGMECSHDHVFRFRGRLICHVCSKASKRFSIAWSKRTNLILLAVLASLAAVWIWFGHSEDGDSWSESATPSLELDVAVDAAGRAYFPATQANLTGRIQPALSFEITHGGDTRTVEPERSGHFTYPLSLRDGERLDLSLRNSKMSAPVRVTLVHDAEPPTLGLRRPKSSSTRTTKGFIDLVVEVGEEYLSEVRLLGHGDLSEAANGAFVAESVLLPEEGENVFEVEALDLAGNRAVLSFTVVRDTIGPQLVNISPKPEVELSTSRDLPFLLNFDEPLRRVTLNDQVLAVDGKTALGEVLRTQKSTSWEVTVLAWDMAGNVEEVHLTYSLPESARSSAPGSGPGPQARLIRHGRYRPTDLGEMIVTTPSGQTSAGVVLSKGSSVHIETTKRIPCRIGERWGFEFELTGLPDDRKVTYVSEMHHPPIPQPGGELLEVSRVESQLEAGAEGIYAELWTFIAEAEYELVPGRWTRTVSVDGVELLSVSFDVVGEEDLAASSAIARPDRAHLHSLPTAAELIRRSRVRELRIESVPRGSRSLQNDLSGLEDEEAKLLLLRFYDPGYEGIGTLGSGWHLFLPYRIEPEHHGERAPFLNVLVLRERTLTNLVNGVSEVLELSNERLEATAYVPPNFNNSAVKGAYLLRDLNYLVEDREGNEFHLDGSGRLDTITYLDQKPIHIEYGLVEASTYKGAGAPSRVVPRGVERVRVPGFTTSFPAQLALLDANGTELAVFDKDPESNLVVYRPAPDSGGPFMRVLRLRSGGYLLKERYGSQLEFGDDGSLVRLQVTQVQVLRQGDLHVEFESSVHDQHSRIDRARLSRGEVRAPILTVDYTYDLAGRLSAVSDSRGAAAQIHYGE